MGTVGISFGSPTSGQGFDVATTVSQIVAGYRAVETPWQNQLTALKAQDTALSSIGTDLASLSTSLQSLTDFQGVLAGKQGSSSDTDVLQLTSAGTSAVAGSHTIEVTSLASTASYHTDAVASASDLLNGTVTVTLGGVDQTISTDSGGDNLSQLATNINSADAGVTASVVTGSGGPELSIVSNTSGAAGNFSISGALTDASNGGATVNVNNVGQTGADASLTVDGIAVTSSSNTVTSAIQGVTFQLLSSAAGTPVQVEITNDNSSVESAVSTFVTAYNKVVGDLTTQEGNDSSGNPEPLFGSSTVALLQQQLQAALTFVHPAQATGTTTAIASSDALSGSLSIKIGAGNATTVDVDTTNPTLAGLAAAINANNLGVTASVNLSGGAAVLSIVSTTAGSGGAIAIDSSGLTDTTSGQAVNFGSPQSNAVTTLDQLGITAGQDGTLSLDTDTLDDLLNSNYQAAVNFLQPNGEFTTFGGNLTNVLNGLSSSDPTGALYLAAQQNQTQEATLNTNITNEEAIITQQQTTLTDELNLANYTIEEIPSQLNEINELYSSITGYNTGNQ